MPLRLIFMGTPDFAVPTLVALAAHGHEIVAVYTREAKPSGRGMKLQPSPVAREAQRLGIPVLTPKTLKTQTRARSAITISRLRSCRTRGPRPRSSVAERQA